MIESGIGAMEDLWLPPDVLEEVRGGNMQARQLSTAATPDLFGNLSDETRD